MRGRFSRGRTKMTTTCVENKNYDLLGWHSIEIAANFESVCAGSLNMGNDDKVTT